MKNITADTPLASLIADSVVAKLMPAIGLVPVGISARHVHLSPDDLNVLFGENYRLKSIKMLSQPGQFASDAFVELVGSTISIKLRVIGPTRKQTQVEISRSDANRIGIDAPVRHSGVLDGTPGGLLRGPQGSVQLKQGVIVADRHLHLTVEEALAYRLRDGDKVRVYVDGDKAGIMENITVRAGDSHALDLHIDTDDANAFGLEQGKLIKLLF